MSIEKPGINKKEAAAFNVSRGQEEENGADEKFTLKTIDLKPALREAQERSYGVLKEELDRISIQDIGEVKQRIEEGKKNNKDGKNIAELENLEEVVNYVASLRDQKDEQSRQNILNRLAKKSIYKIADAEKVGHYLSGKLEGAIILLEKVVFNLAQADFPEELKIQEKYRAEDKADEIKEMIEKTKNIKIT